MSDRMRSLAWRLVATACLAAGCKGGREAQCSVARRTAASAWQAYEASARDRVNHLDEEAGVGATAARDAATRAQATARETLARLRLVDVTVGVALPQRADAAVDDPRARLAAVRAEALTLERDVADAATAAQETATAVISHDPEAARAAASRSRDAAGHAASTSARVAAHAPLGPTDPIVLGLAQISQDANVLVAVARTTADAAESAASAADEAAAGLERANAALTASGAAFRSPAEAREAAHAVGDDPSSAGLAHARAETEAAWSACQGN